MSERRYELFDLEKGTPLLAGRYSGLAQAQIAARSLVEYEIWRNGRRVDFCRRVHPQVWIAF